MLSMIYGDETRVFVNTVIGCEAECQYCYLPKIGADKIIKSITAEEVVNELSSLPFFVRGKQGTIISLGCYSECWSEKNKNETIKVLSVIAKWGNYIQLATKQSISEKEIFFLNSISLYKNQIGIYLSIPTITFSETLEKGTACIKERLLPLQFKSKVHKIYFVLYIKPVLKGITLCDKELYRNLIEKYQVYVVVGSLFWVDVKRQSSILVGEGYFHEKIIGEAEELRSYLKKSGCVFEHSIEVIQKIKQKEFI